MGLFKSGYEAVQKEQERQEKAYENMKGKLFSFFLTEGNPAATILFLNNEPVTFYAHQVETFMGGGKRRFETKVCTSAEGNCSLCESGDRPSMKGAFLVWDTTPFEYTDKNGKKQKSEGSLRLYTPGIRVLGQLDRLNTKHGLTNWSWEVSRTGTRTSTTYSFDRDEQQPKRTAAEIRNMLPEALKDTFKPKSDSADDIEEAIMDILRDQCERLLPDDEDGNAPVNTSAQEVSNGDDEKKKKPSLGKKLHAAKTKAKPADDEEEAPRAKARVRLAVRK